MPPVLSDGCGHGRNTVAEGEQMLELDASGSASPPVALTSVHATTVHLAVNNSDFVLVFAVVKPWWSETQGLVPGASLEPLSAVTIAPLVAKQLVQQLTQALASFEKATGSVVSDAGEISTSNASVDIEGENI